MSTSSFSACAEAMAESDNNVDMSSSMNTPRGASGNQASVVELEDSGLTATCIADLKVADGNENSSAASAVCSFYVQGRCRFGEKCRNLHDPSSLPSSRGKEAELPESTGGVAPAVPCSNDEHQSKERRSKHRGTQSESPEEKKDKPRRGPKKSMRTAADVIDRIRWDPTFEGRLALVDVGYLDRFFGTLERSFDSFNWEDDLASVAESELAIPQHRISFFKYRGTKIWDKDSRLDLVFNSTSDQADGGSPPESLEDVLARIDHDFANRLNDAVGNFACGGDGDAEGYSDYDDDEDGDEEPSVTTGPGLGKTYREQHHYDLEDRSTHFLAVRITEQEIVRKALMVQENAKKLEPVLGECCMKEGLFHITFCMLRLEDRSACQRARELLDECAEELKSVVTGSSEPVEIRGLKTFGSRVLYAGVVPPLDFWSVEAVLRDKFTRPDLGIKVTNHFEFVPHMTIMKVSRPVARERRSKYIDPAVYIKYADLDFGKQPISNINLCIIDEQTRRDGFYQTLADISLL